MGICQYNPVFIVGNMISVLDLFSGISKGTGKITFCYVKLEINNLLCTVILATTLCH